MTPRGPVVGADGCRGGWLALIDDGSVVRPRVLPAAEALLRAAAGGTLALDIPIGLPEAGARACDVEARRRLGPRRSSVFPAPVRAAIDAPDRATASQITEAIDGRRVAAQAFAIFPKIREVDALLRGGLPERLGVEVREVHPELCFWAWAGRPMRHPKKRPEGKDERRALLASGFGGAAFAQVRGRYLKREVADDDIADAFAALWTARRIVAGRAGRIPEPPPRDAAGLPMEMVY